MTTDLPQPTPEAPPIIAPQDAPYPGVMRLVVDATDVERCIFRVRQAIPATPGPMTLLYPKWVPGYHSPAAPIELFAGLEITAGGVRLPWRRDPVEVFAFHIDVPDGTDTVEASFQYLSPTSDAQGPLEVTSAMLVLRWSQMVLYPAGFFVRRIPVDASVVLPPDWTFACPLEIAEAADGQVNFARQPLDVLTDSPLMAGRWTRSVAVDDAGAVNLNLFADRADLLAATEEQIAPFRALVAEADQLFGVRHFDHYDFLVALSGELGANGVEHHRCCEIVTAPDLFTAWDAKAPKRDVIAHEYVHSWNGKFRRGADSWTPSFERPIRNSLMWVYEGLTQYWGEVLAARSGLWTADQARDTLARTAAVYANRPGGRWRTMSDTTRDPIIASRQPLPWPSWQRSEDYYAEGQLLWLDIDTLIRERSADSRSLDDFAYGFFGVADPGQTTCTYEFDDVVRCLAGIVPYDWRTFLTDRLESREVGAPLDGLRRGGYELVYRDHPTAFALATDAANGVENLRFSLGLAVSPDGVLQEVLWESPAFDAGLTAGAQLLAVNGRAFELAALKAAVTDAQASGQLELLVQRGQQHRTLTVVYSGGHRYPHLAPIAGARPRLDEIFAASSGAGRQRQAFGCAAQ